MIFRWKTFSVLILMIVFALVLPAAWAAPGPDSEPLWADLNKMPAKQREAALIEGAKKEGTVVHYTSTQTELVEALEKAFKAKYSFLSAEFTRTTTPAEIDKLLNESRAGRQLADVIFLPSYAMYTMIKEGILGKYNSPERAPYPAGVKSDYTTAFMVEPEIVGYNKNLMKPETVPKTPDDLANPALKKRLGRTNSAAQWVSAIFKIKGEEEGRKFIQSLTSQEIRLYSSNTALATAISSGEISAGFDLHLGSLDPFIKKGAPVAFQLPSPPLLYTADVAVARKAPHPYAAALLIDFLLSKDGQSVMAKQNWNGVRPDVAYPYADLVKKLSQDKNLIVYSQALVGPKFDEYNKYFLDLFLRK